MYMDGIYYQADSEGNVIQKCYAAHGLVVIKKLLDDDTLRNLRDFAVKVTYKRAQTAGIDLPEGLSLDDAFNRMCAVNRALGGNVFDCLRAHPGTIKLISDKLIVSYIELLLGTRDIYYAIDQINFRIDRKNEERFALPWHQDHWWTNTSKTAITVWYSLFDVPHEVGPMSFILGSHKQLANIRIDPYYKVKWNQYKLFEIAEPINEDHAIEVPVEAGDVVFLHALALHRSGRNQSDRNRWTVVTRYADLFDPEFVARGWKSGIRIGYTSLVETDPNCIVNLHEVIEPQH
jgi:ectoine hydroxylase-related dioxygenase (phytanoyl-CoA dioxygenase family)